MAVFSWGDAGAQMTPERIAAQRKVAEALMERGMDVSPIQSPWQGAARVAQAMMGGYDSYRADEAEKANRVADRATIEGLMGGGATSPAPTANAQPMGKVEIPAGKEEFISGLMPHAEEAGKKTGIDPRIIVAQAALESGWGKSAPGNNLFGIKSHGQPNGNELPTTEVVNGQPVKTVSSFRAYPSQADSVDGYADFINKNPRYAALKSAQGLDAQVAALGSSGYATDPQYGAKVGQIARELPAPAQMAQATPPKMNPALVGAMTSPYSSDATKKIAGIIFQQQIKNPEFVRLNDEQILDKHTGNVRAAGPGYTPLVNPQDRAKFGIDPTDKRPYQVGPGNKLINPPAENRINIDQRGEAAFDTAAAKHQAERFDKLVSGGMDAKAMTADLGALKDIGSRITTGKTAEVQAAIGPYAEALGVKMDGLDDLQAYKSIVAKLAPRMRVVGSGATSDYEMRQFLEALPGLGKTQGGNEMIASTLQALQEHKEGAAEIASKAMNKELTPREADKMLRELPDPLTAWKAARGKTTLKPDGNTTKSGVKWSVE